MSTGSDVPSSAHKEFDEFIAALSTSDSLDARKAIDKSIWERFGCSGTAFISDMANFSSTSRTLGISHFLKLIYRAREIIEPIIDSNNGTLLKSDGDNCYAYFEFPDDAIRASMEINSTLFEANRHLEIEDHIYLSVGIDYGDLLLIGSEDFYGDPVNTASKLGEDLAGQAETLVTERAMERSSFQSHENAEHMVARISDIEINYVRFTMATPVSDE
ncbi:MAG: adenylate/guanylate cyclase domain-containing protein [Gammaproteobacteria bacterium]|nr:adenylate/guanylate cyclase domain-containing protein [Gammaproteobacteria bacterium]